MSLIELNNGVVAVSLDTLKGYSLFPKVRVLFDENHRLAREKLEIPLFKNLRLCVTKVLDYENIHPNV